MTVRLAPNTGQSSVNPDGEVCAKTGHSCGSKKLDLTITFATKPASRDITFNVSRCGIADLSGIDFQN